MTTTQRPSATATIAARYGLRPDTVAYFGLHDVLLGVASTVYPVIAAGKVVGRRCKYTPAYAARGMKYQTLSPPPHYPLYNGDTITPGCVVYLLAGEPDVWVAYQAGLIAVCFLMGEGCVPALGVRLLAERRPAVVRIVYDLDAAGRTGAEKAYHAITGAGLLAEIGDLPDVLGYKGDTADLYHRLHYDDAALHLAMGRLPYHTPAPRAAPSYPRSTGAGRRAGGIFERAKARADIVRLARRLTPLHANHDESRFTGLCPFHDDHNPSFVVWPATEDRAGRFCCRPCGLQGDVIELTRLALERGLLHGRARV